MLIDTIKFLHLLLVLSLLGLTLHCVIGRGLIQLKRVNISLISLAFFGMITGTFLVHPRGFTFHTHWIIAAYLVISGCILVLSLMLFYQRTWRWLYLLLSLLLIVVIHDAVIKATFF